MGVSGRAGAVKVAGTCRVTPLDAPVARYDTFVSILSGVGQW